MELVVFVSSRCASSGGSSSRSGLLCMFLLLAVVYAWRTVRVKGRGDDEIVSGWSEPLY